ncbi:MAG: recombinase family protein [Polyangiaceae bacterium]
MAKTGAERTRWVSYLRVSTVEQAEKELSLTAQRRSAEEFAARHDTVIDHHYVEPGASGTDTHRPVLNELLGGALRPGSTISTIVVHHTSRFTRDATHARVVKKELRRAGVRVVSVTQELAEDPMGTLMEGFFECIDQYESEVNGLRTAGASADAARDRYGTRSRAGTPGVSGAESACYRNVTARPPWQSNVSGSVREKQAPLLTALGSSLPAGRRERERRPERPRRPRSRRSLRERCPRAWCSRSIEGRGNVGRNATALRSLSEAAVYLWSRSHAATYGLPSLSPRANFVHRFVIDLSQARKTPFAQMEPPRVTRLLAQPSASRGA